MIKSAINGHEKPARTATLSGETAYLEWEDDEALIRQLYGLSQ
ncbi:MAG: hypothetical protein PHV03_06405 [Desulfitobacteriaceae bacterium]|nr:hypothetical protein [Desulfitobacteriaceae bacterium]MDD4402584.1 hypothetical protein [Desulfitobacteriaceae bacterium]